MKNPWLQLPSIAPRVLPVDCPVVEAFNDRYVDTPRFSIQTHLMPEPFVGDPDSPVYVLCLNPGYSPDDDQWHSDAVFVNAITMNINQQSTAYPFFFFNPELAAAPGSKWWTQHSRWLIDEIGQQVLANNMFCVELFPYHSCNYKPIPKSISDSTLVPSCDYSVHLVRKAISANKTSVALRAFAPWCKLIPELTTYGQLHRLNSPQNVALSPNNLAGYNTVVRELKANA